MSQHPDDAELAELFRTPIQSLPITRVQGWARPDAHGLKRYPDRVRVANLICDRRSRTVVAVVLPGGVISTSEGVLERLGSDFFADCRCGRAHAFDTDLLRRAILDLPERKRGQRPPVISVRHVERQPLE